MYTKHHFNNINSNKQDLVELNVNGITFLTSKSTLEKSGYLVSIVNDAEEEMAKTSNKDNTTLSLYIDRDDVMFRKVLKFLRNGVVKETDIAILNELKEEALFYEILGMAELVDINIERHDRDKNSSNKLTIIERVSTIEGLELILNCNNTPINYRNQDYSSLTSFQLEGLVKLVRIDHVRKNVWNCPKGIKAHVLPGRCGKKCLAREECEHTGWVLTDTVEYVVAHM